MTKEGLASYINEHPNVRDVLTTSGWVKDITVENKGCAVAAILVHEVLAKRKVSMDQLRKGLESLQVLSL